MYVILLHIANFKSNNNNNSYIASVHLTKIIMMMISEDKKFGDSVLYIAIAISNTKP